MEIVELNFTQVLLFVEWSETNYDKYGWTALEKKLKDIGMTNINRSNGTGKKATYTFTIPTTFWSMLMVDKYSPVCSDCFNAIINGNVTKDGIVLFDRQLVEEIATKYSMKFDAVNSTFKRIKKHLSECGLIGEGENFHRVKFKEDGKWIDGRLAFNKDQEARDLWKRFYKNCLEIYKQTVPEAIFVPGYLLDSFKVAYFNKMKRIMNVHAYKTVRKIVINSKLNEDIFWAKTTFLNTKDMSHVRTEINKRQTYYRQENTASVVSETVDSPTSKEQSRQAYNDLKRAFEVNLI
jgi:hypothetical protein